MARIVRLARRNHKWGAWCRVVRAESKTQTLHTDPPLVGTTVGSLVFFGLSHPATKFRPPCGEIFVSEHLPSGFLRVGEKINLPPQDLVF